MKLIRFLAAAAIVLTASTAMAQGGPPGGGQGGAQRAMEAMMQGITLTDAQKAKVDSIVAASRERGMKLRQEAQAAGVAAESGRDEAGDPLVPASLKASPDRLSILPMARHAFTRKLDVRASRGPG